MKFKLIYKGEMKTHPKHRKHYIHNIRSIFHEQLKTLIDLPPYWDLKKYINPDPEKFKKTHPHAKNPPKNIVKNIGGVDFIPIINPELNMLCELEVEMFHPELLGTARADIDNRLKTLLDCLKRPQTDIEVPEEIKGGTVYTLLDDDKMITRINVNTSHLLAPLTDEEEIILIISVNVKATRVTLENMSLVL